jgi:membrane protein implicated in regulation of membrane protease activity
MSPWIKYLLFQIPGWIIAATVLALLVRWESLSKSLAVVCFIGWLVKDLLVYPFFRRAYEPSVTGSARLVGSKGIAEGDLNPNGYIRVRGELWRAVVRPGDQVVKSGAEVEVVSAERMEVFVRALGTIKDIRDAHSNSPTKLP